MKIVIPGGSGQVGTILARAMIEDGHDVVVLSRHPGSAPWRTIEWDGSTLGNWTSEVDGADVVINLAGKSVNCRYSAANRNEIFQSRVLSTRVVGQAIAAASRPPTIWLQASTATIYAHRYDAPNAERTGLLGGDEPENSPASTTPPTPDTWSFSIEVAKAWERELDDAVVHSTRKVALRSAMTMSPDPGGIFDTLAGLVRRGLGGRAGNGRQYVSWIHETDFVRAVNWLIENEVAGTVNLAAPHPLPNADFMKTLRQALGVPIGLPATRWMLEIGAFLMGTETELILKSRRVVPGTLVERGFEFDYPTWPAAAKELCTRWRRWRQPH